MRESPREPSVRGIKAKLREAGGRETGGRMGDGGGATI